VAEDNPYAAERLVAKLMERAEGLASHPAVGRRVPEAPSREALREVVEDNYRIVHRAAADKIVEIVTVIEGHLGFARATLRR